MPASSQFNPGTVSAYLASLDMTTVSRGRNYYRDGAVRRVDVVQRGKEFEVAVRGSREYSVNLALEDGEWMGDCSCPVGMDCKHCVAAILYLQAKGFLHQAHHPVAPAALNPEIHVLPAPRPKAEPPTDFHQRVAEANKRGLSHEETLVIRALHRLHQDVVRAGRQLMLYDLQRFLPQTYFLGYEALDYWETPPTDPLIFWQYCAKAILESRHSIPDFLDAVTDLSLIEKDLAAHRRKQDILEWQNRLAEASQALGPAEPRSLDLRLAVLPHGLVLQCRSSSNEQFESMKTSRQRRLNQDVRAGTAALTSHAAQIWTAFNQVFYFGYDLSAGYGNTEIKQALNQILRLPTANELLVDAEGQPLARPVEPLRWDLAEPAKPDGNYNLRLVDHQGNEITEVLCAFPGRPTLYLTPNAVYHGPSPCVLGETQNYKIPAPALETNEGVQLLTRIEAPLPPRMEQRIERVKASVTVSFKIAPFHSWSKKDGVFAKVAAVAPGEPEAYLSEAGWYASFAPRAPRKAAAETDKIRVVDWSVRGLFPALLHDLSAKDIGGGEFNWRIQLSREFPERFAEWLQRLPPEIAVELDPELATLRDAPVAGTVRLDIQEAEVDWFDLKVNLEVADPDLTPEELKLLLNAKGRFVRLGSKGWRRLKFNLTEEEDEHLARLGLNPHDFDAEPQRLHALQLADRAAAKFLPAAQVEAIQRRAEELKVRVAPVVPPTIQADLRPYQVEGYHFLAYLTANRFGGVLADDMGLGKTLQALSWIEWLRAQPEAPRHPSLVVCPKSVMDNWRSEAARFVPSLRVLLWDGAGAKALPKARANADLLVLNYAQLRTLSPEIAKHPWHVAILDEAQYIKNPDAQAAQAARALKATHRLALTGTPIENRLLDLWSIMSYAMPGVLGNRQQFLKRFNQKEDPLARRRLSSRVRPFLIRRTKSQVATDLPDRIEEDILCELEGRQKTLYTAEYKRARQWLLKIKTQQDFNSERFNFLTFLLRLRQICCHPSLISPEFAKDESAKVNALVDMIEPLMEEGHKVLVFSQFVSMLEILKGVFDEHGWKYFYLAGDTENRGDLVRDFQSHEGEAVFLISLKAGGFGLNLTAASYVVLFDPWWNPAVEAQAIDRTHRIGQTSKVIAYRLLMKDSIEQKIRVLQKQKAALAGDVLGEETFAKNLTLEDLQFLFTGE